MWPYDDGRSRGMEPDARMPRAGAYYDDAFDRQPRYQQPLGRAPEPPLDTGRSRRKSILVDPEESSHPRHQRHSHRRDGVRLEASDDGYHPDKTSRHDAEHKTTDRNRDFRKMRGGHDSDEAAAFKRASKSYSPNRSARDPLASRPRSPPAAKSAWPDDDLDTGRHGHRSSKKKGRGHEYPEDDLGRGYGAPPPPRAARDMVGREPPYYGGYDDGPKRRYPDPLAPAYPSDDPPRHSRHTRERDIGEDSHTRGRRPPPGYDNPYDDPPSRHTERKHRDRQSMPPQSRYDERYPDPRDDGYHDRPRRRASIGPGDRYSSDPRRRGGYDAPERDDGHAQSKKRVPAKDKKGKKAAKEAGSLFMTHAMPVIKKEAVPFLMKSAQAYISQRHAK